MRREVREELKRVFEPPKPQGTLIDMCVRLPKDQREMLMVSGVGAHKYSKYGQRFLTEITVFMRENPSAVLSTPAETI